MSITTTRQEVYDCALDECEQTRTKTTSVEGSYCSRECADRQRGRDFLANIRTDHRFCWSCFRARKEIERPTDSAVQDLTGFYVKQAVVGFEYHTEHVEMGPHGLECECGACDHAIEDWNQRESGPYAWWLKEIVDQMRDEGQHERRFDIVAFCDTLWETDDLELAVGRADVDP
jgi:hypothetical protein